MNTSVVNVKVDPEVKKKAQEVAEKFGFSLSVLINDYLKTIARTKKIEINSEEEPSDYFIKSMKESEEDIKKGFVSPSFDNAKDALAWLDNPKRKYVNQLRKKV